MKALVIYDSAFGNTERVARAMGEAIGGEVRKVTDVQRGQLTDLDVLIVGSPTQKFQPLPAIKKFLRSVPNQALDGVRVAAFDTRIALADVDSAILNVFIKLFGYAAKPIADRLKKKGGELAMPPEGFYVEGTEGPLKEGELERAKAWVKQIS